MKGVGEFAMCFKEKGAWERELPRILGLQKESFAKPMGVK